MEDGTNGKNSWLNYVGRFLRIWYEDGIMRSGSPHISKKEGKLLYVTDTHLILEQKITNKEVGLLKSKILRFEANGGSE